MVKRYFYAFVIIFFFSAFFCPLKAQLIPKREFRGVWIATVANIDWPSRAGLPTAQMKKELTTLLDSIVSIRCNTVIFQVRPTADAFYKSSYEPWSKWLTGVQGKPPPDQFDPLAFITEECRKRCLELHAWVNPFRVSLNYKTSPPNSSHIASRHPDWVIRYGKGLYFDPGIPEVREYITRVIKDIVRNYDIDAIHIDDYFYPYKIQGQKFSDTHSFQKYPRQFRPGEKEAWRRDNVNKTIQGIREAMREVKPSVLLGISPFGVWRNDFEDERGSQTDAYITSYGHLYADVYHWVRKGWVDYVIPQVYWQRGHDRTDYTTIVSWWANLPFSGNVYVGQGLYRVQSHAKDPIWRNPQEMLLQIAYNRRHRNIQGNAFYSATTILKNRCSFNNELRNKRYRYPALVPENSRVQPINPHPPQKLSFIATKKILRFRWEMPKTEEGRKANRYYVVYRMKKNAFEELQKAENIIAITSESYVELSRKDLGPLPCRLAVTAVSPTRTESFPSKVLLIRKLPYKEANSPSSKKEKNF